MAVTQARSKQRPSPSETINGTGEQTEHLQADPSGSYSRLHIYTGIPNYTTHADYILSLHIKYVRQILLYRNLPTLHTTLCHTSHSCPHHSTPEHPHFFRMKMRLKSRQTTLRVIPITASADMTENRVLLIGTMFSLGIPPGYRRWGGRKEAKKRETGYWWGQGQDMVGERRKVRHTQSAQG